MDNQAFIILITFLAGVFFIVFGIAKSQERDSFLKNGIKTEGVVFKIEKRYSMTNNDVLYHPVIRYVTKQKDWITEEYDIGNYPCLYNEGDKVTVIYDPIDNKKFIINDKSTKYIGPFFIVIGIAAMSVAIYYYLFQIPHN